MPKRPHPPPTRRKKTPKAPETADEYLAVAVELEESGERWRSGDVAKAGRFFVQAITAYESTLVRYPNNFDARYNRARLLYTLTQLPLSPTFFPTTSTPEARLLAAAEAHHECNDLEQNSSDILFNYGQTLSSLGEFYANKPEEGDGPLEGGEVVGGEETLAKEIERLLSSKQAFENSWSVLQQCLVVQEADYKSTLEQSQSFGGIQDGGDVMNRDEEDDNDDDENGGVKLPSVEERRNSTASSQSSNSGGGSGGNNTTQWASILEPTTKLSILDTALTMLEVQTSILTLSTPATATKIFSKEYLEQITIHANTILENYILPIAAGLHEKEGDNDDDEYSRLGLEPNEISEKEMEATLSRTNFLTALAETKYYLGLSTLETWEDEVKSAFDPYTLYPPPPPSTTSLSPQPLEEYKGIIDLTTSWMALCDRSTAYTTLSTTILPTNPSKSWKLLSTISPPSLSSATKLAPEKEKPGIYLARGNLELLRSKIPIEAAMKGKEVLLKNAGVYYRGVVASAGSSLIGAVDGVKIKEFVEEARVKEAVIKLEHEGDWEPLKAVVRSGVGREAVWKIVKGAVEDGVFGKETLGVIEAEMRG
ncbi:hypothetical protein AOL_s00083g219 [Orbilia oligospora ATCC 24927]|uniref:Uncharacterized protein n=1 Tax=Arthrobotrys oligospora (strain ATCC 24927 / CBS 115.81 / DSM 1491) TaxID=756982 RepID=G1XGT8_ARTOA|nr:hypothetical protein AOL_s00083g219 [Orbilia oligospora ATCC 24927]EGX47711.1 hypothetical protein AOL_s00083g219 [Orbilia oligospora ATCC 24927]